MKIKCNLNGQILAVQTDDLSYVSGLEDSSLYEWQQIENYPQNFLNKIQYYSYLFGNFIFDNEKFEQDQQFDLIENLRRRRETECFSVINRGKLWYDNLTNQQLEQLQNWYQAWLNVTETLQPPEYLGWL